MDDYEHLCPVCKEKGLTNFLQLRQINLDTAVYLCKDIRCIYPQGHSWIFIKKNLGDDEGSDTYSDISDEINEEIENMSISMSLKSPKKEENNLTVNLDSNFVSNHTNTEIKERSSSKVIKLENLKEVNNVVIDNGDNLFGTLSLPFNTIQPKVLAVGSCNTDTVFVNDTNNDFQFDLTEEQPFQYKLNIKAEKLQNTNSYDATATLDEVSNDSQVTDHITKNVLDFKTSFNTKLKIKGKREPKSFPLSDTVLQQAMLMKINEPTHKPNLVELIKGQNKNGPLKNSAASFEGFKFSSEVIKKPSPNTSITECIKGTVPPLRKKETTEPQVQLLDRVKFKQKNRKRGKAAVIKKEIIDTPKDETPTGNTSVSNDGDGEQSILNEWLENLGDTTKIKQSDVDPEFDDWLFSL